MSDLDRKMTALLLRFELVSHGSTQAWNPSGGFSGEPDDKMVAFVAGHPTYPHLQWRQRYESAATVAAQFDVYEAAKKDLETWTHFPQESRVEPKSLVELVLEDGKGFEPRIVAQKFGVPEGFVRRKRMLAGLDHETGEELVEDAPADRLEVAAELSRRGLSQAQVARAMGVSQPTVHRLLKQARFRRSAA